MKLSCVAERWAAGDGLEAFCCVNDGCCRYRFRIKNFTPLVCRTTKKMRSVFPSFQEARRPTPCNVCSSFLRVLLTPIAAPEVCFSFSVSRP